MRHLDGLYRQPDRRRARRRPQRDSRGGGRGNTGAYPHAVGHAGAALTGGEWATQELHFHVGVGARLEYYPERTLPFAGSRFRQHLRADLGAGAEFGLLETLASGRVQMGERLAWADYRSEVSVYAAQERVYLDRQHFRPGPHSRAPGVLGGNDYFASGVWVAGDSAAGRPAAESPTTAPGWASGLSAGGAVWARGVAATGPALDHAARQLREQVRHDLFGAAPLVLRR